MKKYFAFAALITILNVSAQAQCFDKYFQDKTLRLDYVLGGTPSGERIVLLDAQSSLPGWAGRRHNLSKLPLEGNGIVTVCDEVTGDTIYRTSFSSLYHEWLSTDEATSTPKGFEHTVLVPFPKAPAIVHMDIRDSRHNTMSQMQHRFSPEDILITVRGEKEVASHRYLHKGANTDRAIDVAILAEGYTTEEMDNFYRDAQIAVDAILAHEPFKSHADDFNFVAVASPSLESGVSVPRLGDWKRTAFSSHFSTFYSDRYLTSLHIKDIHNALAGIPYEHIIILANTSEYGGGGIYNSYTLTAAGHKLFRQVVVHEFGHSFGGLADEYFYEGDVMDDSYPKDVEPWEPNITTLVDFDSKWKSIVPDGCPVPTPVSESKKYPVGVYEGGGYSFHGVYRPADDCRMRTNTSPEFCPACQRALDMLIKFYVED